MAMRKGHYSGIGGQAVLEGVMMKNNEKYAVAVRKPDGEIEVELENYQGVMHDSIFKKVPFIRGVFNFLDSLVLGTKCLNYSASFYEDEDAKETTTDKVLNKVSGGNGEKVLTAIVMFFSIVLAIGIFILLPYFITSFLRDYVRSDALMAIIEGIIRIVIFLLYVLCIAAMKDIKRLYMYHGAEHKCINCLERGKPLTVRNAMRSSRLHKRCGTSFLFFVMFISIILFFFIRVNHPALRVVLRILLIPVVAGISYELIRLAGRSENIFVRLLSAPGMWIQRLTTKEPTKDMVEVAIASVEAVFDWRKYLAEEFGYEEEPADSEEHSADSEEDSSEEKE
ncbi:MAG: DUF1385 domain-containing protein [Lachnospiraceae bacterium]|nr:DUF1385 domain-containing protein [Lachnospiraceae bacterium]